MMETKQQVVYSFDLFCYFFLFPLHAKMRKWILSFVNLIEIHFRSFSICFNLIFVRHHLKVFFAPSLCENGELLMSFFPVRFWNPYFGVQFFFQGISRVRISRQCQLLGLFFTKPGNIFQFFSSNSFAKSLVYGNLQ